MRTAPLLNRGSGRSGGALRGTGTASTLLVGGAIFFSVYVCLTATYRWSSTPPSTSRILLTDGGSEVNSSGGASGSGTSTSGGSALLPVPQQPCKVDAAGAARVASSTTTTTTTTAAAVPSMDTKMHNPRMFHVVTTVQGFANHWQARVHYWWYEKQRRACRAASDADPSAPPCDMGGFTRLLHSGKADDLMDEIPTVVVDPLPESMLKNTGYVVLNRPWAFIEWVNKVSIPERYVLMCEADHLFMRPLPNMMNGDAAAAALFTYIIPQTYANIVRKFTGNISDDEIKKVPQIGNSPTFVTVSELRVVAPMWYNTTVAIFDDEEAHKAWNWVLEMYGYALATYNAGFHKDMRVVTNLLAHPPFDKEPVDYKSEPFHLLHLTYPCRYTKEGNLTENSTLAVWEFDKRVYSDAPPPRNLKEPPPVVENKLVRMIVSMINEATASIPCWDDYFKNKVVTRNCAEARAAGSAVVAATASSRRRMRALAR